MIYTVTYGDRSTREPEYEAPIAGAAAQEEQKDAAKSGDIWLYVGIGVFGLAVVAVVVLLITKKKKPEQASKA